MTVDELGALIKGIAPIVRQYIDQQIGRVETRIKSAEDKALIPGPQGERGERGLDGKDGSGLSTGYGPPEKSGKAGDLYLDTKTGDVYQCL